MPAPMQSHNIRDPKLGNLIRSLTELHEVETRLTQIICQLPDLWDYCQGRAVAVAGQHDLAWTAYRRGSDGWVETEEPRPSSLRLGFICAQVGERTYDGFGLIDLSNPDLLYVIEAKDVQNIETIPGIESKRLDMPGLRLLPRAV